MDIAAFVKNDNLTLDDIQNLPTDQAFVVWSREAGLEAIDSRDTDRGDLLVMEVQLSGTKPLKMKLSPRLARQVGEHMNSYDTANWIGKRTYLKVMTFGMKRYFSVSQYQVKN